MDGSLLLFPLDAESRYNTWALIRFLGSFWGVNSMPCKHLHQLYEICQTHNLKLSSTDLIRIVCPKCGVEDVCPSLLCEEYDSRHHEEPEAPSANESK